MKQVLFSPLICRRITWALDSWVCGGQDFVSLTQSLCSEAFGCLHLRGSCILVHSPEEFSTGETMAHNTAWIWISIKLELWRSSKTGTQGRQQEVRGLCEGGSLLLGSEIWPGGRGNEIRAQAWASVQVWGLREPRPEWAFRCGDSSPWVREWQDGAVGSGCGDGAGLPSWRAEYFRESEMRLGN